MENESIDSQGSNVNESEITERIRKIGLPIGGDANTSQGSQTTDNPEVSERDQELCEILLELRNRNKSVRAANIAQAERLDDMDKKWKKLEKFSDRMLAISKNTTRTINQNIEDIRSLSRDISALTDRVSTSEFGIVRIETQRVQDVKQMMSLQDDQDAIKKQIKKDKDELVALVRRSMWSGGGGGGIAKARFELPTFSAAVYEKPGPFLKTLINYLKLTAVDYTAAKALINQALKGPAKDLWEHVEPQINDPEQFQAAFLNRYWNQRVQDRVRHELELGYYQASNNLSRSEYVYRLYNSVKMLDEAPPETFIVRRLAKHFDEQVQQAVVMQEINTLDDLIKLLDSLDQAGSLNSIRGKIKYEDFPSKKIEGRPFYRYDRAEGNQRKSNPTRTFDNASKERDVPPQQEPPGPYKSSNYRPYNPNHKARVNEITIAEESEHEEIAENE